jgi:Protein of unknown function
MSEIPEINSELRWNEVRLPSSVSETDLDGIILSVMTPYGQKMAMVLGALVGQCRERGWPISKEALAARIQALVESDRLEGAGDLRMWRFSEVRLKN